MSIRIVADSACDVPQELVERLQIQILPAVICSGDQRYLLGVDIDREVFYRELQQEDVVRRTSLPSPSQLLEAHVEVIHSMSASAGADLLRRVARGGFRDSHNRFDWSGPPRHGGVKALVYPWGKG